jgi:hypothetical protein
MAWAVEIGTWGIIAANALFLAVRFFARSQGLKVRWWSRSYAPEREYLRRLVSSPDAALAQRARRYLRLEILAWVLGISSIVLCLCGVATR